MRIGAVFSNDGRANAFYRALLPLHEIERRGHKVTWPASGSSALMLETRVPSWDLAYVFQCVAPEHLEAIRRLSANGVAVVWDSDDDISTVPRSSPAYRAMGGRRKIREHAARSYEIARTAHLMTTPSAHLADTYRSAGAQTKVIENMLAGRDVRHRRSARAGVVVGCTAGFEHLSDFKAHKLSRVLRRLLSAHPSLRVISIGLRLDLRDRRYEHVPHIPVQELVAFETRFDIGIAPLADTALNRARSNVKLKEYAAAGAAWLASPIGPYASLGEEHGGQLVPDGQWETALGALITDHQRRRSLAELGRRWAERETIGSAARIWENAFRDAVLRAKAK